jgi:sulfur relay protein TusB/DsrH
MHILYTLNKNPSMQQLLIFTEHGGKILFLENAVAWLRSPYSQLFLKTIPSINLYTIYAIQDDVTARNIPLSQLWQENNLTIHFTDYAGYVDLVASTSKIINI